MVALNREEFDRRFSDLFEKNRGTYLTIARRITGNNHLAEDVLSHGCVIAIKNFDKYDSDLGELGAWFTALVSNVALDFARKEGLKRYREINFSRISDEKGGLDHLINSERRTSPLETNYLDLKEYFLKKIRALCGDSTSALLLYVQGLSYQEIADRKGIPLGTVKSEISSARKDLKKYSARDTKVF